MIGARNGTHVWLRANVQFPVNHSSKYTFVERVEAYFAKDGACDLNLVDGTGKGTLGQHTANTFDDTVIHDFIGNTRLYYDGVVRNNMTVCARSSSGLSDGSTLLWGNMTFPPWTFELDNQGPFVDLKVYDSKTAATGVWEVKWKAHDYNGSGLFGNVTVYDVDTPACVSLYGTPNHDFVCPPPVFVCEGPHDGPSTTDPNWFASQDPTTSEQEQYQGGCIYDTGSSSPPCLIAIAEDSARTDVVVVPKLDADGNLGSDSNDCNSTTVPTPFGGVVLVLAAILVGLGVSRRANRSRTART